MKKTLGTFSGEHALEVNPCHRSRDVFIRGVLIIGSVLIKIHSGSVRFLFFEVFKYTAISILPSSASHLASSD